VVDRGLLSRQGAIFGEESLLSPPSNNIQSTYYASSRVKILFLTNSNLRFLVKEYPDFVNEVMKVR
jgi:CRP-like cAMP-binding protein